MTYKQILLHPAHNRQLDMWDIKNHKYMVTTSKHWLPPSKPGLTKAYNEADIVRIEFLIEIKPDDL